MADILNPLLAAAKGLYVAGVTETIITGANVRSSMLPGDARTGLGSFAIAAGGMPIGAHARLEGAGIIGARLTTPPGFNFIPWVSIDSGVTKTDLPGFATAPLLGTDGTCGVWLTFTQLASGIRTGGYVYYGMTNGQPYFIPINGGGTGSGGAAPSVVASNSNVDRTFGVDGFWGSGADSREYVKCRNINIILFPAAAA